MESKTIRFENLEGRPIEGRFISAQKTGRTVASVVLEKTDRHATRFRELVFIPDLEDALKVAGLPTEIR